MKMQRSEVDVKSSQHFLCEASVRYFKRPIDSKARRMDAESLGAWEFSRLQSEQNQYVMHENSLHMLFQQL